MKTTISRDAANEKVKMFYQNTESNDVPVEDVYVAADRTEYTEEQNKTWLGNVLWTLKPYNLVKRNYGVRRGKKRLVSLSLTDEGLKVLGRDSNFIGTNAGYADVPNIPVRPHTNKQVTLQSITDDVDEFNRQNPSWEIEIVFKRVKKGEVVNA